MVTYDYLCDSCDTVTIASNTYEERDILVPECEHCGEEETRRVYVTAQIRTEKLSRTFIDSTSVGGGRPKSSGIDEHKKIADLQVEQLNHSHHSDMYKGIKEEIADRKSLKPKKSRIIK